MTIFGWDASNYDDPPTMRDGLDFYTHKAGEGHHSYYDREYGVSLNNANSLGIPVLGAYFVNHPGSVADQVDWFVQILDQDTPWWRKHSCFILQIDAEKFDYMPSAPTKTEIQVFGDRLVNVHGVAPSRVIVYAPQWLYGNSLSGLTYRLWASAYGGNPVGYYRNVYPGDNDGKRWQAYSGQTPMILQYGSNTTIANQTTSDANAYRGSLSQFMSELGAGSGDIIPKPKPIEEDDMVKGIIVQGSFGVIRVFDHPTTGRKVKAAVRDGAEVAAWVTAGWGGPVNVTNNNIDEYGEWADNEAKSFIEALGSSGISGGGGLTDHVHTTPAGSTGSVKK